MDRESAFEMLQKGVQATTQAQNAPQPPAASLLRWMTVFCGGKRDGVVQTMAKSAARQVTNQIVRGMLGSLLGGRRR
ncbi:helicase HerA-like domain-containing protein [Enterobacter soli]|uniref:helicase HerA-like domain-containing protein n=1 Tax=Enterobacter soli TaxID=885040 RepID=UPI004046C90F